LRAGEEILAIFGAINSGFSSINYFILTINKDNKGVIMKFGFVLILIALNVLCISAIGQSSENPFGSATSNSISLKGDIYYLPEGASSLPDFSSLTPD
jgi:hypothetical protein